MVERWAARCRRGHSIRGRLASAPGSGRPAHRRPILGPDRAANLLELVVLITAEDDEVIIYAMPMRATYRSCSNHDEANVRTLLLWHADR